MDAEIPVLTGYLIVPTQSGFSINRISKKVIIKKQSTNITWLCNSDKCVFKRY